MISGLSEHEAQLRLCSGIAERSIAVRVTVATIERGMPGRVFGGGSVFIPNQLRPDLFDWTQSRPLEPWSVGPGPDDHHWRCDRKDRSIDLLEVSSDDVTRGFGRAFLGVWGVNPLVGELERLRRLQDTGERRHQQEMPAAIASLRSLNGRTAKKFASDYVRKERDANRRPTLSGLEAAAKDAKFRGGRELLRTAYRQIVGDVAPGRPRKSKPKSAEK
jgi:hypothetical protein